MSTITLPVGTLLKFNSMDLSEHNRRPVTLGYTRIEQSKRMSNGSLRKYYVADKKRLTVSWDMLPSYSTFTIDGGFGALDLKKFYEGSSSKAAFAYSGKNTFDVTIKYINPDGSSSETLEMVFGSFSCDMSRRNVRSDIINKKANITAATANGSTITYTAANTFSAGDIVTVTGLQTDLYDVYNATIASANSTSFTVSKTGGVSTVTEAKANGTAITYYASNTFAAGDVISISGFKSKTITAASANGTSITFTSVNHGFEVGDAVNITGTVIAGATPGAFNISNAVITAKADNTFTVASSVTGTYQSGGTASSVYNRSNVEVASATDYYFTVAYTTSSNTMLTSSGQATVFTENTQFPVTGFVSTKTPAKVVYTSPGHDFVNNDKVTISGIRSTATITNAEVHVAGQVKYTAANTFQENDIITISDITPSGYNGSNVKVISATSEYFIVANTTTEKFRKSGVAKSVFNLENISVSEVSTNTFTLTFAEAENNTVTGLTGVTASKTVNYVASVVTTVQPQEFWSVSLTLEEV